jgi:hypothetical protein
MDEHLSKRSKEIMKYRSRNIIEHFWTRRSPTAQSPPSLLQMMGFPMNPFRFHLALSITQMDM